jgi:serine/threonine protein kinase
MKLSVISGNDKGKEFPLPETGTLQIGRGKDTDTHLQDLRVSRNHCRVQVDGGRVLLVDNQSKEGTFVNDQKIDERQLRSGDKIRVGDTVLQIEMPVDMENEETLRGDDIRNIMNAATQAGILGGNVGTAAPPEAMSELLGRTLDRFEVIAPLASGYSSVYFRARDTTDLREVALKVLRPGFAKSDAEMERVARLLKSVMALEHPNVVTLIDVGKTDSYCWFALELVEGESLAQMTQQAAKANLGMLDWQHALRMAMHLARGLDYLHGRQLSHRYIAPRTILVNTSDKVAKLGPPIRSRALEGSSVNLFPRRTDQLRDLPYTAPERAREDSLGDGRADIYSLGATVYEMITGRPPFDSKNLADLLIKILQGDPVKPREYQLLLPEAFERVILKMMAKKPEDRYQTPKELLADLERVIQNPNVPAGNGSLPKDRGRTQPPPPGIISVECECGQQLQARSKFAGTKVRCPGCGNFLTLPGRPTIKQSSAERPAFQDPEAELAERIREANEPAPPAKQGRSLLQLPNLVAAIAVTLLVLSGLIFLVGPLLVDRGGAGTKDGNPPSKKVDSPAKDRNPPVARDKEGP